MPVLEDPERVPQIPTLVLVELPHGGHIEDLLLGRVACQTLGPHTLGQGRGYYLGTGRFLRRYRRHAASTNLLTFSGM